MNTGLGINFYRTVNEEGSNGWAQVYARIPFDDYELKEKGSLFGVIEGKNDENWADIEAELMEWVDEFFNKTEDGGVMMEFAQAMREKYGEINGAWLWMMPRNGKREIKIIHWGAAGVGLMRNGSKFDLSPVEGKIIKGEVLENDELVMWSGKLGEILHEEEKNEPVGEERVALLGNKLLEARAAGAGLFFVFNKYEEEMKAVSDRGEMENTLKREEPMPESFPEKIESDFDTQPIRREETDLVSERLVGPVGVKEKIINWWKSLRREKSDLRIDNEKGEKRKKWAVLLGIVFLIILVVSLVVGSIKIKANREAKSWNEFSEPIQKGITEAEGLVKINPSGAKKIMEDVKNAFNVRKAEFVTGKYKDEVIVLENKINSAWTVASGEKQSQIEELINIQLVRPGFGGDRLGLVGGTIMTALDSKMGLVMTADTKTKDVKVAAGMGEAAGWIDVINDGKRNLVLNKKGIMIEGKEGTGVTFDSVINTPVAMGRFGVNIYVLDQGNKEIYKYAVIGNEFGERSRWLKQGQLMSIMPVDMAIDSDIWVLGDGGSVERYRRGAKEVFVLNGAPQGFKPQRIAVEGEGNKLALLDRINGFVLICGKELGNCDQQLKAESLKQVQDIEFDAAGNLLVLKAGTIGVLK